ncbi:MAG: translocation/assembly module TamB domain-containing protein [Rhodothermales bacterium]
MLIRITSNIVRAVLTFAGVVLFAAVLLFFAVTRSQVGRDTLARQIETEFNQRFFGELHIETMTGNLARTMYLSGISITDETGHFLLEMDSLIVVPRWTALWSRKFSVRRIEAVNTRIHIRHDGDRSNIQQVFRPTGSSNPWAVQNAAILLDGVQIHAARDGGAPLPAWMDWLIMHPARDIQAEMNVAWSPEIRQVDLLSLRGRFFEDDLMLSEARSQLVVSDDQFRLTNAFARLGASSVAASGSLARTDTALVHRLFQLEIPSSALDLDELRRLVPDLTVAGQASVSARIQGAVSDMAINWMRVRHNNAAYEASGTIQGLPESARFELSVDAENVPFNDQLVGVHVQSYATGTLVDVAQWRSGWPAGQHVEGNLDLQSPAGRASASFDVRRTVGPAVRHRVQIRTDRMNLGPWLGRPSDASVLTGTLVLTGTGTSLENASTEAVLSLNRPQWNDRRADRMTVTTFWERGFVTGQALIEHGAGRVDVRTSGRVHPERGPMRVDLDLTHADVGPLLADDNLSTDLTVRAAGSLLPVWDPRFALSLDVVADSSTVSRDGFVGVIQPQHAILTVQPPGVGDAVASLVFPGAEMRLESDRPVSLLVARANAWYRGFQHTWMEELAKPLTEPDSTAAAAVPGRRSPERFRTRMEAAFVEAGETAGPGQAVFSATVRDAAIINAIRPHRNPLALDGATDVHLTLDADRLLIDARSDIGTLSVGSIHAERSRIHLDLSVARSELLSRSMTGGLRGSADRLSLGGLGVNAPTFSMDAANGRASVAIRSSGIGQTDSLSLAAVVHLLDDRNAITVQEATVTTDGAAWALTEPSRLDVYSDAIRLSPTAFDHIPGEEFIRASGTLSSVPTDSLHISAGQVRMEELSAFLGIRKRIGGMLNSELVLTGGLVQPQLAGYLELSRASFEDHTVGNLFVESRLVAGTPEVSVDVRITPLDSLSSPLEVANDLRFHGTMRLPSSNDGDDGRLDLQADLERVDLFFFQYIFNTALSDVAGFATGDGTIRGTFKRPVFQINAGILDGTFSIPKTGLSYRMDGDVRIDADAIHVLRADVRESTGGSGRIAGRLDFNEYREFTLDLGGDIRNLQIIGIGANSDMPFYGYIWASGTFALTGPLYDAVLRSNNAVTTPESRIFIPIEDEVSETDESFIVFEDSVGVIPDFQRLSRRTFLLARRPAAERQFLDALDMDLNIQAPSGSMVHLVIDPLLGDVINASSRGSIQLVRENGEFFVYGELQVAGGDYLFTAGDVFQRRFFIQDGGTMRWDGDPLDASLDIVGSFRTRASLAGLSDLNESQGLIPLIVELHITGTVSSPAVDLALQVDRSDQNVLGDYQALEARLNRPDRATEYATSVLLTNSFILTTENISTESGGQLAFNSVSQLVSAQLNRFLNAALPNVEFNFGLQGENAQDLDVTYGVALRLVDERLIIRGEGVYQGANATDNVRANDGLQGEFVVEIRLTPRVAIEVFYRREGDILQRTELTNTGGVGVSYQTDFTSWRRLLTGQ